MFLNDIFEGKISDTFRNSDMILNFGCMHLIFLFMVKKILVVDDEEFIDELLQQHLGKAGFQTISFFNSQDALEYIENNPSSIDLAIIDHNMPGISGAALAERLRAMMPELPIIIMAKPQEGIEFGEYTLLKKPATKDELLEAIKKALV